MSHDIKTLATFFDEQYTAHVGTRYPFNNGKDAKILKDLRGIYSDEQLHAFMVAFFQVDDDFIRDSGYSLGAFRGCLTKVIKFLSTPKSSDKYGHSPACATHAECIQRVIREGREVKAAAMLPLRSVK